MAKKRKKANEKTSESRRASNKDDKLRRIKAAAREAFMANDFDRVTTRAIAQRAGVALGTLFIYASDKRDLLFLAINQELDEVIRSAGEAWSLEAEIGDNLLAVFGPFYRYFAQHPHLSRLVLREMIFYEHGGQAKHFLTSRGHLTVTLRRLVHQGLANGEIRSDEEPEFIAWQFFAIYQVEIRRWLLSDKPNTRAGLARLRRALNLIVLGLKAVPTLAKPQKS